MRLRFIAAALVLALAGTAMQGGPARKGILTLPQPDGTSVEAYLTGDENGHVMKALDGSALVQSPDGWWCYARFSADGRRENTGYRYADPETPAKILTESRNIPSLSQIPALRERRAETAIRRRETLESPRPRAEDGIRRALVMLVAFSDLDFRYTKADFEELIAGENPESARSYFNDQWAGVMEFQIDITDIITLSKSYQYYGQNDAYGLDTYPHQMVSEACRLANSDVDFSLYDNDDDGAVDNVFIFFAGPDESEGAGEDFIWSHQWYLSAGKINLTLDGKKIDNYACTAELKAKSWNRKGIPSDYTIAGIGNFCHEYTHTFGIADLYDTDGDGSGGYAEGAWSTIDLMDSGNQNNGGKTPPNYGALEKFLFGIGDAYALEEGLCRLAPGEFRVLPTDDPYEFILVECRSRQGWDQYIGGEGLLVSQLDLSSREAGNSTRQRKVLTYAERWSYNEWNANPDFQGLDILEPDPDARATFQAAMKSTPPDYNAVRNLASHAFWPWDQHDLLSNVTTPALIFHSGAETPLALTGIHREEDGSVTFQVAPVSTERAPSVHILSQVVFQDASILRWSADDPEYEGSSFIRYGLADEKDPEEIEVFPYEPGKYAYTMEGLKPYSAYKVQLCCKLGGIPGPVHSGAGFTTKAAPETGAQPYIYLKDSPRNTDLSFAKGTELSLRVYNLPEGCAATWFMDENRIAPGADGYYVAERSGLLKAVVTYPDGTTEILLKLLTVR